jgi:hypothetical protein
MEEEMSQGRIIEIIPQIEEERLRVRARVSLTIKARDIPEPIVEVHLPDRELAALLPRTVLVGDGKYVGKEILPMLASILTNLAKGRKVKIWEYGDRYYCRFVGWKDVRFASPAGIATTST